MSITRRGLLKLSVAAAVAPPVAAIATDVPRFDADPVALEPQLVQWEKGDVTYSNLRFRFICTEGGSPGTWEFFGDA